MDNFASIRDVFGRALLKLGEENKQVVVLYADVSTSTRTIVSLTLAWQKVI